MDGDVDDGEVKRDEKRTAKMTAKTDGDFFFLHLYVTVFVISVSCGPAWSACGLVLVRYSLLW